MECPDFSARMLELLRVLDGSDAIFRKNWEKPSDIRHKGRIDLVTDTDLAIEEYLKHNLKDLVPGAVFLAEESATMARPEGTCWIIDPVDGTTNFAHRFGDTVTSVALWENGQVVLGAISAPYGANATRLNEEKGHGSMAGVSM